MRGKTANATVLPGSFNIEHCGCSNVEAAAVIWLPCLLKLYRGSPEHQKDQSVGSFLLTSTYSVFVIKIEQKFQLQQIGFTNSTVASFHKLNAMLFSKI